MPTFTPGAKCLMQFLWDSNIRGEHTFDIGDLHEEGLKARLFNWPWSPDWIGTHSTAKVLVCWQDVRGKEMRSGVPVIAQQLPSSETWPIKTAWNGHKHTHTHRDVCAPSVYSGPGPPNIIAPQLFGFGKSIAQKIKPHRHAWLQAGSHRWLFFFSIHFLPYPFRVPSSRL